MKDAAEWAVLALIMFGVWVWAYPEQARETYEILTDQHEARDD